MALVKSTKTDELSVEMTTTGKAAKRLGVHPATVRGMIERNEIEGARQIGVWWRIPVSEVERIQRGEPKASDEQAAA